MPPTLASDTSPPATDCSPKAETNAQQRLITGPLPLQQPIPSASSMPSSHKASLASHNMASSSARSPTPSTNPNIERFESFITSQRQLHDDERALWRLERADLQAKIRELEAVVRRYRSQHGSIESSASSFPPQKRSSSSSTLYNSSPPTRNISTASTSTIDDEWHPPNNANSESRTATRTFSDLSYSSGSTKVASLSSIEPRRLSNIDEEAKPATSRPSPDQKTHHTSSIDGAQIHPSLDGIMFKPMILNPPSITLLAAGVSNLHTDSPSPTSLSPTSTTFRPAPLDLSVNTKSSSSQQQTTPQITLNPDSFVTQDAGHTPLPSKGAPLLDPATGSSPNSQSETSTPLTANFMFPPRVPRGSIAPPELYRGRKGSRWPGADGLEEEDDGDEEGDGDRALRGPLGLKGGEGDNRFLSELNQRLETAAKSRDASPSPLFSPMGGFRTEGLGMRGEKGGEEQEREKGVEAETEDKRVGEGEVPGFVVDQPEQEPKLRIKRSMNFGSQLCGKIE